MAVFKHLSFSSLSAGLAATAKEINESKFQLVLQKVAMEALTRLVMKTPVDSGRARGNWQVTWGSPSTEYDSDKTDDKGSGTIWEGADTIADAPRYGVIWISNNVPYIERLENGWSGQAPNGMAQLTVDELKTMFARPTVGDD